jgi:type I restriction-modification system DNA methylase subunit
MQYPSINIQGNLISGEILEKTREQDYKYQNAESFGFSRNIKLPEEIGNAWAVLRRQWETFKIKADKLGKDESGITETRQYWVNHLLNELGYEVEIRHKTEEDGLPYINSICKTPEEFPIHVEGIQQSLDRKPARGGSSPHGRMQEYLNKTDDHLYGLITNGKYLRLLRDASRLIKLTYLEFNLEKMMEEELYADFAVMFRILHASRMPKQKGVGEDSYIEFYHLESLAAGTRIREKLSEAVEKSIVGLANGFLEHPSNRDLIAGLESGEIKAGLYYKYLLRLIYRILFLSVIEERHLIYKENPDEEQKKLRDIYYRYYSIERHRKLADKHLFIDKYKQDLWDNLLATFRLFENEHYGSKLGIKPLAGDLFGPDSMGILSDCRLGNQAFMEMMLWLNFFEDERKQKVRVNYGDLDVEEFGSVYEGLLEYDPDVQKVNDQWVFKFKEGDARSRSGSHYTPEELVKPLIKHSLDYIIQDCINKPAERLKLTKEEAQREPRKTLQEKALLAITVCDIACGSGHILLSAERRIATELARVRTGDEQPDPISTRIATRDVIRHCIYGVDLNPLAVELCKVALWLEAHSPGEPLNFLDHRIKCGNSIVGLAHKEELEKGIASEAFKTLPGDTPAIAASYKKQNDSEKKTRGQAQLNFEEKVIQPLENLQNAFNDFNQLPETTPAEIEAKQKAYGRLTSGSNWWRLKNLADMQVAQFFIPKTEANKDRLVNDAKYREYLRGTRPLQDMAIAKATSESTNRCFFHYFLEFPEIFASGGFDCILGNPPYLGDKKQKKAFGEMFLEYVRSNYTVGINDLVVYFFNRIFELIQKDGYQALITTSSISQGDMRIGALDNIQKMDGNIIFAVKSIRWPGAANLNVALVVIKKGIPKIELIELNGKREKSISSFLTTELQLGEPFDIKKNSDKMFTGYYFLGDGYLLSNERAQEIINSDPKYKEVIYPFINGDDINDSIKQENSRSIINFFDWPLNQEYDSLLKVPKGRPYANDYPICLEILETLVKPERQRWKLDEDGNEIIGLYELRKPLPERWWIYGESRPGMRYAIKNLEYFFATAQTTKYLNFVKIDSKNAISQTAFVYSSERFSEFIVLQSVLHFEWAVKYGNVKGDTFRYAPSKTFETFPFPKNLIPEQENKLEKIGETYHEYRRQLMLKMQLGLTKTYNAFHAKAVQPAIITTGLLMLDSKAIEKLCGKEVWYLWNHLQKTPSTCSMGEAIEGIVKLRELHIQMDLAVLGAYGWSDIDLRHDFYEVDYLPENDRVRFTIHPDARKEILKRLLELNHQIFEEEARKGLHDEKTVREFFKQKGKDVPNEVIQKIKEVEKLKKEEARAKGELKKKNGAEGTGQLFSEQD